MHTDIVSTARRRGDGDAPERPQRRRSTATASSRSSRAPKLTVRIRRDELFDHLVNRASGGRSEKLRRTHHHHGRLYPRARCALGHGSTRFRRPCSWGATPSGLAGAPDPGRWRTRPPGRLRRHAQGGPARVDADVSSLDRPGNHGPRPPHSGPMGGRASSYRSPAPAERQTGHGDGRLAVGHDGRRRHSLYINVHHHQEPGRRDRVRSPACKRVDRGGAAGRLRHPSS